MNHSADETRASLANNLRYFIKWSLIALLIGGVGALGHRRTDRQPLFYGCQFCHFFSHEPPKYVIFPSCFRYSHCMALPYLS